MSENQNMTPAEQLELEEAPNVYNYHETSRVLVGVDKADLDALTYAMRQRVEWLVPANATLVAPPQFNPETQVAVFDPVGQVWEIVAAPVLTANPDEPLPTLNDQISSVVRKIDSDVDEIIFLTIGNRATEYLMAEQAAAAFRDAGYPADDVPAAVEDDMLAFGRTAQEAADAILNQAASWRSAQQSMRRQRLMMKTAAYRVAGSNDLGVILEQWGQFVQQVRQQLGV